MINSSNPSSIGNRMKGSGKKATTDCTVRSRHALKKEIYLHGSRLTGSDAGCRIGGISHSPQELCESIRQRKRKAVRQENPFRLLLQAANQVTDDESEDGSESRPEQHIAPPSALVRRDYKRSKVESEALENATYIGRPLAAPPRLPNVPFGYKITSAVVR